MGYIYAIYSKTQPRVYIGQSIRDCRWSEHKSKLLSDAHFNPFFQNHFNKYGLVDLEFYVLDNEIPVEYLTEREQLHIDNHDALGFTLFNAKLADPKHPASADTRLKISLSSLGRKHSVETKTRLSVANTGKTLSAETKAKLSLGRMGNKYTLGYNHSPESKAKMSMAKKGIPLSKAHIDKLCATKGKPLTLVKGGVIHQFKSCKDAAEYLSVDHSAVVKVSNNKQKTVGGWMKWEPVEPPTNPY